MIVGTGKNQVERDVPFCWAAIDPCIAAILEACLGNEVSLHLNILDRCLGPRG